MEDKSETIEIPDKNTNSSLLDELSVSIEADQDEVFSQGGIDTEPSLYVSRDYMDEEYTDLIDPVIYTDEEDRTDYDPRPKKAADFLDDPDKVVF